MNEAVANLDNSAETEIVVGEVKSTLAPLSTCPAANNTDVVTRAVVPTSPFLPIAPTIEVEAICIVALRVTSLDEVSVEVDVNDTIP